MIWKKLKILVLWFDWLETGKGTNNFNTSKDRTKLKFWFISKDSNWTTSHRCSKDYVPWIKWSWSSCSYQRTGLIKSFCNQNCLNKTKAIFWIEEFTIKVIWDQTVPCIFRIQQLIYWLYEVRTFVLILIILKTWSRYPIWHC